MVGLGIRFGFVWTPTLRKPSGVSTFPRGGGGPNQSSEHWVKCPEQLGLEPQKERQRGIIRAQGQLIWLAKDHVPHELQEEASSKANPTVVWELEV